MTIFGFVHIVPINALVGAHYPRRGGLLCSPHWLGENIIRLVQAMIITLRGRG